GSQLNVSSRPSSSRPSSSSPFSVIPPFFLVDWRRALTSSLSGCRLARSRDAPLVAEAILGMVSVFHPHTRCRLWMRKWRCQARSTAKVRKSFSAHARIEPRDRAPCAITRARIAADHLRGVAIERERAIAIAGARLSADRRSLVACPERDGRRVRADGETALAEPIVRGAKLKLRLRPRAGRRRGRELDDRGQLVDGTIRFEHRVELTRQAEPRAGLREARRVDVPAPRAGEELL